MQCMPRCLQAINVYKQYAMLIIGIPMTKFWPEFLTKALSTNDSIEGSGGHAKAFFALWPSSLDCLMASYGPNPVYDDGVTRVGIKVVINTVVSTVVLYLSALVFLAVFFFIKKLRVCRVCTTCCKQPPADQPRKAPAEPEPVAREAPDTEVGRAVQGQCLEEVCFNKLTASPMSWRLLAWHPSQGVLLARFVIGCICAEFWHFQTLNAL